jgi:hypothetical protein
MRILPLTAVVLCAGPALAELRQHGNLIYDLPEGWSVGRNDAGIRTLLHDGDRGDCEFCYVYLSAGVPKSGRLAEFVVAKAPLFIDADDRRGITVLAPPEVTTFGPIALALYGLRVDGSVLIVMGFQLPDRFELVAFDGEASDEKELATSLALFEAEVQPMFTGLRFVSLGATPLLPDPQPGPLNGIYWGWFNKVALGIDGMLRTDIGHRTLVFWADGHFFEGEPPAGLQPLDRAALMAVANADFGTYSVDGNRLTLTFADGSRETLSAEGDGWADGNTTIGPVSPLADGTRIDGMISSFFYSGFTPGAGLEGGMSSASETRFFPDGTYAGSSFSGASANFTNGLGDLTGGYSVGNEGSEGGRYEIRDGLLIQFPADGSAPRSSLVFDAGHGMILIGEQFLDTD